MRLHENPGLFRQSLVAASQYLKIRPDFVEKDYWICLVLSRLSKSSYQGKIVFKGGTSLSKGFKIIDRFSEDVDIAIIYENLDTGNQLKKIIRTIEKEITTDLKEIEIDGLTSKGSRFRKSIFEYPSSNKNASNNKLIIEINSFANPYHKVTYVQSKQILTY